MTKEQRTALASMNGWFMVKVVTVVLGVGMEKGLLFATIPCMLVTSYYQHKFFKE